MLPRLRKSLNLLKRFGHQRALSSYQIEYKKSIENPSDYWAKIAEEVVWTRKWDRVMDDSRSPFTKWFVGGRLSLCYNAVDRHVDEGRGQTPAIIWDSPITKQKSTTTYAQLQQNVSLLCSRFFTTNRSMERF